MDDNISDEDFQLYIMELKSEDPNLKIFALSQMSSIADIIGPTKIMSHLLPSLIQIIEDEDNEDEFLLKISDEIFNLLRIINQPYELLGPLQILSSMEEPLIRDKAVQLLVNLSENQTEDYYLLHFFNVFKQLALWENYPARISACKLLPVLLANIEAQNYKEIWSLFENLTQDNNAAVRRSCADILSSIARIETLPKMYLNQLTEFWNNFFDDISDSVKISAISASPLFLNFEEYAYQKEEKLKRIVRLIENKNWRIRYTIPELLPLIKDQNISIIIEQLLKDSESEVRTVAINNFHKFYHLIPLNLLDNFLQIIQSLSIDPIPNVRIKVAEQISCIAQVYNTSVVPIVKSLLQDEIIEIKEKIVSKLPEVARIIGQVEGRKCLVPLVLQSSGDKQWRFRYAVIMIIPKLLAILGCETYIDLQDIIFESGLLSHYFDLRIASLEIFKELINNFGYDKIEPSIITYIQELSKQNCYKYRITSLQALVILKFFLSSQTINMLFQKIYFRLIDDPIANVRLNTYKCTSSLVTHLEENILKEFKQKLSERVDKDQDVSFYASQLL